MYHRQNNTSFTANFWLPGLFNHLAALGITKWLATWVRQLYQGDGLQDLSPRQSPAFTSNEFFFHTE